MKKQLLNNLYILSIGLLPFAIFLLVLTLIVKNDSDTFLALLEIIIWPFTLILSALFFRRVITYLFFSMEEFNFFGAKGKIKDVNTMILEKAEEIRERDVERAEFQNQISELEQARKSGQNLTERAVDVAEKIQKANERLSEENNELRTKIRHSTNKHNEMINDLLNQISNLQNQLNRERKSEQKH